MAKVYARSPEWVNGRGFPPVGGAAAGAGLRRVTEVCRGRLYVGPIRLYLAYNHRQTCG